MAANVTIYTTQVCPFCVRAKQLLEQKGIDYNEIGLDGKAQERAELNKKTGMRTVPQIFIDDELIGGCSELYALESEGRLDAKLRLT